jgi:hypothetical protein
VAANSEKSNDQGNATNCSGAAAEAIDKKDCPAEAVATTHQKVDVKMAEAEQSNDSNSGVLSASEAAEAADQKCEEEARASEAYCKRIECIQFLKDDIKMTGEAPLELQCFMKDALHKLPKDSDSNITINFEDSRCKPKSTTLKFAKRQHSLKENVQKKMRTHYISKCARTIIDSAQNVLGTNTEFTIPVL